jgi:hypothetical protein
MKILDEYGAEPAAVEPAGEEPAREKQTGEEPAAVAAEASDIGFPGPIRTRLIERLSSMQDQHSRRRDRPRDSSVRGAFLEAMVPSLRGLVEVQPLVGGGHSGSRGKERVMVDAAVLRRRELQRLSCQPHRLSGASEAVSAEDEKREDAAALETEDEVFFRRLCTTISAGQLLARLMHTERLGDHRSRSVPLSDEVALPAEPDDADGEDEDAGAGRASSVLASERRGVARRERFGRAEQLDAAASPVLFLLALRSLRDAESLLRAVSHPPTVVVTIRVAVGSSPVRAVSGSDGQVAEVEAAAPRAAEGGGS